jgi:amidohydrolase
VSVLDDLARRVVDAFLEAHRAELVAFRRHLHAYPELSYQEHETTALIAQRLEVAGLEPVVLPSGCGLVCDVGGGDGPTIALRADIDALAMHDEKDVAYRSQRDGVAHACGHDVHTTIVLGAGLALADALRGEATHHPGRVRLIFEPAEESLPGGAVEVIDTGALGDVDAIYGLHCDPKIDVGQVAVRVGALTSATDMVLVDLQGPGGHTARPHLTVDLVQIAGRVATELPGLVAERARHLGEALLVFGALLAGDAANVIPSTAELRGTLRTPDPEVWQQADRFVTEAAAEILDGTGAEWRVDHHRGIPPVVNDAAETARLAGAARRAVGESRVIEAQRSLGGDSFAWYLAKVPGTYARLGVHDPATSEQRLDLHSSHFDVHEDAIDIGVRVLALTVLDALNSPPNGG